MDTTRLNSLNLQQKVTRLQSWFETHGKTLSFAESCTGGLLSSLVTAQPGVSKFFVGSVVSYTAKVKHKILSVPMPTLQVLGEVSTPVALAMARGAKSQLESDWSVAITGIAGPTGGTSEKPVGLVCFAVVGPGFESVVDKRFEPKEREKIQLESAEFAIDFLWGSIQS